MLVIGELIIEPRIRAFLNRLRKRERDAIKDFLNLESGNYCKYKPQFNDVDYEAIPGKRAGSIAKVRFSHSGVTLEVSRRGARIISTESH